MIVGVCGVNIVNWDDSPQYDAFAYYFFFPRCIWVRVPLVLFLKKSTIKYPLRFSKFCANGVLEGFQLRPLSYYVYRT